MAKRNVPQVTQTEQPPERALTIAFMATAPDRTDPRTKRQHVFPLSLSAQSVENMDRAAGIAARYGWHNKNGQKNPAEMVADMELNCVSQNKGAKILGVGVFDDKGGITPLFCYLNAREETIALLDQPETHKEAAAPPALRLVSSHPQASPTTTKPGRRKAALALGAAD